MIINSTIIALKSRLPVFGLLLALCSISCSKEQPLFLQLDAGQTGITFSNQIEANKELNIINYTNIYNGGGVAVADFNNDGKQDLYFTGSMVENELYLNEGDFQFKNVTNRAHVAAAERWSSGVAAVDINSDGLMDLYVCATTYKEPERRANLLYINQGVNEEEGIPIFKEKGAEYNLADTSNTTMAAFFDYDNDGDLDVYLLVNKFTRRSSMDRYHKKMLQGEDVTTDRLYRNDWKAPDGPVFTDVSDEAGILAEGFGLGVNIADINKDGWKDIYVSNDFVTNDLVYINNGDGTFTDKASELFKHTVHASMGNDIADINNDAHPDVIMVDMRPEDNLRKKTQLQPNNYASYQSIEQYGYDYQYVRNQLQMYQGVNPKTGMPLYSDIGIYAGISETDWSWTPTVTDFDNDGWRDMIITNGFPKDITDHDFADYITQNYAYLSMEKLLAKIPSVKLNNYAFRNTKDLAFENVTEDWGMNLPSFSNGAAQADLDNDGDLDYVVNNVNDSAFVFQNRQTELNPDSSNYLRVRFEGTPNNTMGLGATLQIEYAGSLKQYYEHTTYRGYLSSVEPIAHFGLGPHKIIRKMTVTWPDGSREVIRDIEANQMLTVHAAKADRGSTYTRKGDAENSNQSLLREASAQYGINYVHEEQDYNDFYTQPLLPHKLSQYGPGLAVGDVNGDSLDDVYISGAKGREGEFLMQQNDGTFERIDLFAENDSGSMQEEMGSLLFDVDGDGDDDLYVVSGGNEYEYGDKAYQDRLFINTNGSFRLKEDALPPYFFASGSAVRAADFDKDGDLDLFVGGRLQPHHYPAPVDSYLLENKTKDGEVQFKIVNDAKAPALNSIGLISDALWTDFDNDGWTDLILAGEWMSLQFFKNESGSFVNITDKTGISDKKGWWNSLCSGDFDSDGDMDYAAGNLGTNTFFKADEKSPLRIYAKDFDKNGTYDAILTHYAANKQRQPTEVPFHTRQDLQKQLPQINYIFKSYRSYGSATMSDILAKIDTAGMLVQEANYMQTSYIENKGNGTFSLTPLAGNVQWAPVYGCAARDVDGDRNLDLLVVGNDYGIEISAGRSDALNGLLMMGDGLGNFKGMRFEESGFFVAGDAKSLVELTAADRSSLLLAGQNRGPLKLFETRNEINIKVKPMDASALVTYKDGSTRKIEFYYGSSFLSASGRFIAIGKNVKSAKITTFRGEERTVDFNEEISFDD